MDKHIATGVVAASIAAGCSAYAADLGPVPYQNAPPPSPLAVPPWSWTGFYIGGHFGFGAGEDHWTNLVPSEAGPPFSAGPPAGNGSTVGPVVGGQFGYNYQTGWVVWGVQVDGAFSDIKGSQSANIDIFSLQEDIRDKWLVSVTGRVGGVVHQDTLLYAKGGAAWAGFKYNVPAAFIFGTTFLGSFPEVTDNRTGWTVGFGAEYHFTPAWSAFLEGDFYDFGAKTVNFPQGIPAPGFSPAAVSPFRTDISERLFVVKAGVNFKFW